MMVQTTGWSFESVARCEICGSPERRRLGIRTPQPLTRSLRMPDGLPSTSVFACSGCGLIYSDPRPSGNSVEDVYGTIDDYFRIPIDEQRMRFYRDLATRLAALQPPPGRMLDVGCGRGEFVHAARSVGWDAHGIDPDRHFPEFARQRFGLTTVRALDLADIVSAGERYDAITLNAVLEHIPRPQETLRRAAAALAPGGLLFFEVPHGHIARYWVADWVLRLLGSPATTHLSPFHPPYHLYEFSRGAVARLLGDTGFDTLRVEFWPGTNRFPRGTGVAGRVMRASYGALVTVENLMGRTYNLHVYARRRAEDVAATAAHG